MKFFFKILLALLALRSTEKCLNVFEVTMPKSYWLPAFVLLAIEAFIFDFVIGNPSISPIKQFLFNIAALALTGVLLFYNMTGGFIAVIVISVSSVLFKYLEQFFNRP